MAALLCEKSAATMRSMDTAPEADQVQVEIYRRMTPERRLQAGIELSRTCRELLAEGVRSRHPEYDEPSVRLAVIRILLPENLFLTAYPQGRHILP